MYKLDGKVALVTGASRGIGSAIAVKLASLGAKVFVNYQGNVEAAERTVSLCRECGAGAELLQFDVSDSASVAEGIKTIKANAGALHVLVNNAGISVDGLFLRYKDEDLERVLNVNLTGTFYTTRLASRLMLKAKEGRIINISSVVGEMGNIGQAAYAASKAGIIGLTKSLAKEFGQRAITVNAITPGFIESDMTRNLSEEVTSQYLSAIPLQRFGKAEEVASLAAFLASKEASYITGQVIGINGGIYC